MATAVAKTAANILLKKQMKEYKKKQVNNGDVSLLDHSFASIKTNELQDPYFAMIEDPRRPGKMKKVKKQIPAYIPEHDAMVLAKVRKTAYRLDMCLFNFAGIRFGWEAVIGIIPFVGDAIGVMMAISVWKQCQKVDGGLDSTISMRMLFNIIVDFVVGLIPFLGDLADAAFKCNTKNARLLEVYLDKKYRPREGRDERNLVGGDKERIRKNRQSGIYLPQDPPPATVFEDFSDDEGGFVHSNNAGSTVQQPQPTRQQGRSSWFGGRKAQPAPQMQQSEVRR